MGQASHFVITGRKTYTTMAPGLRFFLVSATLDGPEGPEAAQFLLERGLPGLSVEETWDAVGMRASGSHDLVLEAVRAPADSLLSRRPYHPPPGPRRAGRRTGRQAAQPAPSEGAGWGALIPAVYLGLATAAREEAVRFAARRKPGPLGGQAIGELPAVQRLLGEIEVALAEFAGPPVRDDRGLARGPSAPGGAAAPPGRGEVCGHQPGGGGDRPGDAHPRRGRALPLPSGATPLP